MKRLIASLIALTLSFVLISSAAAQSYYFSLDKEVVNVYWNADGTSSIDYVFTFTNQPGSPDIQFVDVGMPNSNWDWGNISADVDGAAVGTSSDYQGNGTGFAVDLGSHAIRPGQTGRVHVYVGGITGVLYTDDNDPEYASAVFAPVTFGSQYVTGDTDLTVIFHLPPGILPDTEPRYHIPSSNWPGAQEPERTLDNNGNVTYAWRAVNANGYTQYKFGASFPKKYVPAESISSPAAFEFPGISFDTLIGLGFCGFFIFIFVITPILSIVQDRNRKLQYMSPKISIEGHGIKRGLTAVEAAILMETPLDKVMTMILFGVIKKGAAEVVTRDPLKLNVIDPPPGNLQQYETDFAAAFKEGNDLQRRAKLRDVTIKLVKSVSEKMKGFSRRESLEYYKAINEKAWAQIKAADTPEMQSQMFEQAIEWTMLDKNYNERTREVFRGPVYVPMWWGSYDPAYRPSAPASAGGGWAMTGTQGQAGRGALPGADFAASVVTGVQNFSGKVLGDVNTFTQGVTKVTNPPPPPSTRSSSGGRSGGGCACACACAGCACACAGGGR